MLIVIFRTDADVCKALAYVRAGGTIATLHKFIARPK